MDKVVDNYKVTLTGEIPLLNEEYANDINQHIKEDDSKFKTTFQSTQYIVDEFINQLKVLLDSQSGGYLGDYIAVKIELEYKEEDK